MPKADPEVRRIRALRLRAQGLVPGMQNWPTAPDVARGMLAMQAQDGAAARHALSLRAGARPTDAAVLADLSAGRIVRNRPSRGTLQVTAPDDLHWLSRTLRTAAQRAAANRRSQLDLTDAMVAESETVVRAVLADGRTATRAELVAACAAAGTDLDNGQAGHVLRHLTEIMAIVFATPGKTDVFAAADTWITQQYQPENEVGEVVRRFVEARGPVTRQDIGRWTTLPMGDVDAGIEAAGAALARVTLAGATYLTARGGTAITDAEIDAALAQPLLLPAFDEYIIGYGSRAPHLDEQFFDRIVPGRNGMFRPLVVVDGEIVGTWSRKLSATKVVIEVAPFTSITATAMRRLARPVRQYGAFLGVEGTLA